MAIIQLTGIAVQPDIVNQNKRIYPRMRLSSMFQLGVKKLDPAAIIPSKAYEKDMAYDLYALEDIEVLPSVRFEPQKKDITPASVMVIGSPRFPNWAITDIQIQHNLPTKVRTGIACKFPSGYGALIRDRSGVATKKGIFVVAGVIDEGYRGEIIIAFQNPFLTPVKITAGEKIAQMILTETTDFPIVEMDSFDDETDRSEKGFGSSGA